MLSTTVWFNQLINTVETNEWNYPGVLSALKDGFLYLIYGYRLAKLDPPRWAGGGPDRAAHIGGAARHFLPTA